MMEDDQSYQIELCPVCSDGNLIPLLTRTEYAQQKHDVFKFVFDDHACGRCGFVFSRRRPSNRYLAAYYSQYLENLSEVGSEEIDERLNFMGDIVVPSKNVLEIGGGYGAFAEKLAERGAHVEGYDLSFDQGRQVPWTNRVDLVCSYYVGEHVSDLQTWITMQHDVLKDQGHLVIEVPNFARCPIESMNNEHVNHFSPDSLQHFVQSNGFEIVEMCEESRGRYFGMTVLARKTATQKLRRKIIQEPLTDESLSRVKNGVKRVGERQAELRECAKWMQAVMDAGGTVAIWPCNELATAVLGHFDASIRSLICLFDNDPRKTGMNWFECPMQVAIPTKEAVSKCRAICVLSPAYAREISDEIGRLHTGSPRIRFITQSRTG